jgi:hypothetical protein
MLFISGRSSQVGHFIVVDFNMQVKKAVNGLPRKNFFQTNSINENDFSSFDVPFDG